MEYTRLGQSGLSVSRVGLGCMSYGQAASGMHQWTLDEDAAAPFFRQAVELGVTFWDTANVYHVRAHEFAEMLSSSPRTARTRTRPSGIRVAAQAPSPMRSTPSHRPDPVVCYAPTGGY